MNRRKFLKNSAAIGAAGLIAPSVIYQSNKESMTSPAFKDDISLAQWALVEEIRAGKWKTLDFARIAREDFGLNGIEYVNTLFEVPTEGYLRQLKQNAASHDVTNVLIMVDDEGDGASDTIAGRKQFDINHRK